MSRHGLPRLVGWLSRRLPSYDDRCGRPWISVQVREWGARDDDLGPWRWWAVSWQSHRWPWVSDKMAAKWDRGWLGETLALGPVRFHHDAQGLDLPRRWRIEVFGYVNLWLSPAFDPAIGTRARPLASCLDGLIHAMSLLAVWTVILVVRVFARVWAEVRP